MITSIKVISMAKSHKRAQIVVYTDSSDTYTRHVWIDKEDKAQGWDLFDVLPQHKRSLIEYDIKKEIIKFRVALAEEAKKAA